MSDWIVWYARVPEAVDGLAVSAAEALHAGRLPSPAARRTFLAGRALLRRLIADLLGGDPRSVPLHAPAGRRPRLEDRSLDISLSGTDGWVAAAASGAGRVGVDVEARLPDARVARRVLGADSADATEARRAWCAKEACAKAAGAGLPFVRSVPAGGSASGRWGAMRWRTFELPGAAAAAALWTEGTTPGPLRRLAVDLSR